MQGQIPFVTEESVMALSYNAQITNDGVDSNVVQESTLKKQT